MESHSSTVVFASITTESWRGRLSAQYSPATPQPTMTTSQVIASDLVPGVMEAFWDAGASVAVAVSATG